METSTITESLWSLRFDLVSAKLLVWVASIGRDVDLRPETHLYLFDRYSRLAQVYSRRGREARARVLRQRLTSTTEPVVATVLPTQRPWVCPSLVNGS